VIGGIHAVFPKGVVFVGWVAVVALLEVFGESARGFLLACLAF
jgi:hypothetical protein